MVTADETIASILAAPTWDQRVAQIRLISARHGTDEHSSIYAAVAKEAYVPHLSPDFAYIHEMEFYEAEKFHDAYRLAEHATRGFSEVSEADLTTVLVDEPSTLLVFRTIVGLTKNEFAQATLLVAPDGPPFSSSRVDGMEKHARKVPVAIATTIARTITLIMNGSLFGEPPGDLRSKQTKLDTADGWDSVRALASGGVRYSDFLHQRHYGGAFRQILDATSTLRGDLIEAAVADLFVDNGVPHIRTGAHDQGEIARQFELTVQPAPDFVVFDASGTLRAMLECKLVNDGGTARDKAHRFERLRTESIRLGGVPLFAVLSGMGWARVNDTLGPVVRDTEGRVFTLSTLPEMLDVAPFPTLVGTAQEGLGHAGPQ